MNIMGIFHVEIPKRVEIKTKEEMTGAHKMTRRVTLNELKFFCK